MVKAMPLSKIVAKSITDDTITTDQIADTSVHGRRNLILNGGMKIAQRGTSSSSSGKVLDGHHWIVNNFDELVFAQSQSSTAPDGFANSMRFQVTTAESALADNELIYFRTRMEGQDLQHLKFGTSSAESLTLSFWVRSSLTGKYSVLLYNDDAQRSNLQSYTVSAADTWEHKTITIDGDTSNGFDDDANRSMTLFFTLAAGTNYTGTPHTGWGAYSATDDYAHSDAVNFAAQTGSWYITGVQLEVGDKATPFEHRSYGEELALCQRYHYRRDITIYDVAAMGHVLSTNRGAYLLHTPTAMRAKPACSQGSNIQCWYSAGGAVTAQNNLVVVYMDNDATDFNQVYIMADANSSLASVGHPLALTSYHSSGTADSHVSLDAEL